jgi:thiamine-monophosphate kinase
MGQDEFQVISKYFRRQTKDSAVLLGIGDDAAVVDMSGPIVVTTDTMVSGVHFQNETSGDVVGYRVLAANLSDLAAMGAEPRWCTLALTLGSIQDEWLSGFSTSFFDLADQHGVSLIGGDLTRGPLVVTVQLFGVGKEDCLLTRSGGNVDDQIYVTGSLGDSAAGLSLIKKGIADVSDEHRFLKNRFLRPTPRVSEGLAMRGIAKAAIDISDGLLADLGHICESSGCGAVIDVERLPLSTELLALFPSEVAQTFALNGGEDYELCFTASPDDGTAIEQRLESLGTKAYAIGHLVDQPGVVCHRAGKPFMPASTGYLHFT